MRIQSNINAILGTLAGAKFIKRQSDVADVIAPKVVDTRTEIEKEYDKLAAQEQTKVEEQIKESEMAAKQESIARYGRTGQFLAYDDPNLYSPEDVVNEAIERTIKKANNRKMALKHRQKLSRRMK